MAEIDGIGDAVLGGAMAGAVEPATGLVDGDGHTREVSCLNCGTPLSGDYCHACGQRGHVHRTLTAFFHDLLHGVLHFEGKVWRTLPMLAWCPGLLTRRYIDGERARFVSPIALFLFAVFLMFAVISASGAPFRVGDMDINSSDGLDQSIDESIASQKNEVAELEQALATVPGEGRAAMEAALVEERKDLVLLEKMKADGVASAIISREDSNFNSNVGWLNQAYLKAKRNPQLLIYKLQSSSYKFSWALIPLSVPFLWLLFPFSRRFRLYDHTVFVTYSLAFMMLLVVAMSLWSLTGLGGAMAVMFLVPPIHMYRQLRGAYGLSRISAAWRTVLLCLFAGTALLLFGLMMLAIGVTG